MIKKKSLKVGVVGATGMVGQAFMKILEQREFPIAELRPFASEQSLGKSVTCQKKSWPIQVLKKGCFQGLDLVFFSSGDDISKEWAPIAAAEGAYAVDNSAAWRMDPNTFLVVPEVNGNRLAELKKPAVIANPNCSTIQLVVMLKPLDQKFRIKEVRVATYQAVSGAGQAGYDELLNQTQDYKNPNPKASAFAHPILFNCLPHIGGFNAEGFCSEEVKIQKETKKILERPDLKVSAFTVRVPSLNAHSEAVWVELSEETDRKTIIETLSSFEGLIVQDDPSKAIYPQARLVSGEDPVYVGRIHRDPENPKLWLFWVVSDNLRKGAALNGIQIAERLFDFK